MLEKRFELVVTKKQQIAFDKMWRTVCEEYGIPFFQRHPKTEEYFLLNENGDRIGTIAFHPRNAKEFSLCEYAFPFSKFLSSENGVY
jgi:coproporphyrinogen III oxidase